MDFFKVHFLNNKENKQRALLNEICQHKAVGSSFILDRAFSHAVSKFTHIP